MPSKKVRAKNKKADTRTHKDIMETLPEIDIEPLMRKYMGHDHAFHKGSVSQEFIDAEMDPIDKELLDKIKLFIDDAQLYLERKPGNKLTSVRKGLLTQRCQLVFVYANMSDIYERQQKVNKIMEGFAGDELMGKVIKEIACRTAFSK